MAKLQDFIDSAIAGFLAVASRRNQDMAQIDATKLSLNMSNIGTSAAQARSNLGLDPLLPVMLEDPNTTYQTLNDGRTVVLNQKLVGGESPDTLAASWDARVRGDGRFVAGPYNVRVIRDDDPAYAVTFCDSNPSQLPRTNRLEAPKYGIVGDSTFTHNANSYGPAGMVAGYIMRHMAQHFPLATGRNMAIGGTNFEQFYNVPAAAIRPTWYTDPTKRYIEYIKEQNFDVLFIGFGMNGEDSPLTFMRLITEELAALPGGGPDIVWCSNLAPSPSAVDPYWHTIADHEKRLATAGAIRSFAKKNDMALLDFGRAHNMARDGYDPVSFTYERSAGFPAISVDTVNRALIFNPMQSLADRKTVRFKPAEVTLENLGITFQIGAGGDDILLVDRKDGALRWRVQGGTFVDYPVWDNTFNIRAWIHTQFYTPKVDANGWAEIEVTTNPEFVMVRDMVDVLNYGEFTEPFLKTQTITYGGRWQPRVIWHASVTSGLVPVSGDYGLERTNYQAGNNSLLWGRPTGGAQIGEAGGSGYNHPSDFMGTLVYGPVLMASNLFGAPRTTKADYDELGFFGAKDGASYWTGKARQNYLNLGSPLQDTRLSFYRDRALSGIPTRLGPTKNFVAGAPAITDLGLFSTRGATHPDGDKVRYDMVPPPSGMLLLEFVTQATVDPTQDAVALCWSDGTPNNYIIVYHGQPADRNNLVVAANLNSGADNFAMSKAAYPQNTRARILVAWKPGRFEVWINGDLNYYVGNLTQSLAGLTTLRIGSDFNDAQQLRSFVREWMVFDTYSENPKRKADLSRITTRPVMPNTLVPQALRGPYADDAAAGANGVPVGGEYLSSGARRTRVT